MSSKTKPRETALTEAFRSIRPAFLGVGWVSAVINILMLTGPVFMLQVYDRVLASGSVPTLVVIGSLAFALYVFYGLLEGLRGRILARLGQRIDAQLSALSYDLSTNLPLRMGPQAAKVRPVQDLDAIRQFLSGPGPAAIFDIPWMPLYLGVVFLFHPLLGVVSLGGMLVIILLIGLNEIASRKPSRENAQEAGRRALLVDASRRNAEAVHAMGMMAALKAKWDAGNETFLAVQRKAADVTGLFGTLTKAFRFLLQSTILGVGAWLAIRQEITPGVMIAASIMTSRALAPVEQAVAHWRGFVAARQSYHRLKDLMNRTPVPSHHMDLPIPSKTLQLATVSSGAAGSRQAIISDIAFELKAGDGLGIIGSSGSGKSTLARTLVGVVPALRGKVKFDGSELGQWPLDRIGSFIGYLPQDIQLFDGTIAENIARFAPDAEAEAIMEAAERADVHGLITDLPDGYNTVIGQSGLALSGGQKQRIALARALYGSPFLVVLDEPNSNLDAEGETALTNAIKTMRNCGSIVIVIAHRPSAIAAVDTILCLTQGKMTAFGPKEDVMKKVMAPIPARKGAA